MNLSFIEMPNLLKEFNSMKKLSIYLLLFLFPFWLGAQTSFPYTIELEPVEITDLPGLHSYAWGKHAGKYIFIGGRKDGIHPRQPFNAFPASQSNTDIFLIDFTTGEINSVSVTGLPTNLSEQLQSTNMQFYQEEQKLLIIGGYGRSDSAGDHKTYPFLTEVDLPLLSQQIIDGTLTTAAFRQIEDENFAVTGGNLGKIDDTYHLVGGHWFDGRYNPMNMPTFEQEYTNAIRKFKLSEMDGELIYTEYSEIIDPLHLHRRDYNLLPQIYPDGSFGYTIFSGVFQLNVNLPFLYPVDITAEGYTPVTEFSQYLSNYHSAKTSLYDSENNISHNLFFGGISQYYYSGDELIEDEDVPFVKTISRVSRDAIGNLEEVKLAVEMPEYLGAGAEFLPNEDLPFVAADIFDMTQFSQDSLFIGYIYGGIKSQLLNPFTFNNPGATEAFTGLFKVHLYPNENTSTTEKMPEGYHDFKISVVPNPVNSNTFRVEVVSATDGDLELSIANAKGENITNTSLTGLPSGTSILEIELEKKTKGTHFILAVLNGKYFATDTFIID
ncbi:MAG: hypothetical protein ACI85O_000626 [Saprospiraceae bacterium]|jgi:hypothetical protein